MLAADWSLIGCFRHVERCLAYRYKARELQQEAVETRRRYYPQLHDQLSGSPWVLLRVLPVDHRQGENRPLAETSSPGGGIEVLSES